MWDNWRGISLLSAVGKVFTNIILERLSKSVDEKLSENQAGFRKERGCSDQIFTLRRIMEQAKAENITMHMCFVDLKAAYDTVNRKALFNILPQYEVSQKICRLIKKLYQGTRAAVKVDGELTDWFEITTGLRQGCLLSPILFNIYFDFVLREAIRDMDHGIVIEYRMPDGRIVRGTQVEGVEKILVLLYADDLVLICEDG